MADKGGETLMKIYSKIVIDIETGVVLDASTTEWIGPVDLLKQTSAEKQSDVTNVAKGQAGLQAGQQLGAAGTGIQQTLLPAYQQMLKGPSAAETLSTVGGIGATQGANREALTRHAASTGNPAAFTAGLDKLSQTQGQETADAMAKLTTADRDKGLAGMSNLYGVDTATMAKLLDPGQMQPNPPGFWGHLGNAFADTAGKALGSLA
jgi:hypothetical protein